MDSIVEKKQLDIKWIELIREAKVIGLTKEEIRIFLNMAQKDT